MDTPETESNQAQESSTSRLAGLLKSQYGADFTYEAPEPAEPKGQPPETVATEEAPAEATAHADNETEPTTEPEGQPEADTVDFEAEGKQYKVPKELESYLLRDKDYRHKTMELAEDKKAVATMKQHAEVAYQASTQFADIVTGIKTADAQLARFQQVDWNGLRGTDPLEFSNLQHEMRSWMDYRQTMAGQFQQAVSALENARGVEHAQALQRNEPLVRKAIPGWGADKQKALAAYAESQGYKADELRGLTDARAMIVLNKAYQYDQLQAKRPATQKVVTEAPPVNKSTAPRVSGKEIELKKAEAQFKKTGDQEDLAVVLRLRRK